MSAGHISFNETTQSDFIVRSYRQSSPECIYKLFTLLSLTYFMVLHAVASFRKPSQPTQSRNEVGMAVCPIAILRCSSLVEAIVKLGADISSTVKSSYGLSQSDVSFEIVTWSSNLSNISKKKKNDWLMTNAKSCHVDTLFKHHKASVNKTFLIFAALRRS